MPHQLFAHLHRCISSFAFQVVLSDTPKNWLVTGRVDQAFSLRPNGTSIKLSFSPDCSSRSVTLSNQGVLSWKLPFDKGAWRIVAKKGERCKRILAVSRGQSASVMLYGSGVLDEDEHSRWTFLRVGNASLVEMPAESPSDDDPESSLKYPSESSSGSPSGSLSDVPAPAPLPNPLPTPPRAPTIATSSQMTSIGYVEVLFLDFGGCTDTMSFEIEYGAAGSGIQSESTVPARASLATVGVGLMIQTHGKNAITAVGVCSDGSRTARSSVVLVNYLPVTNVPVTSAVQAPTCTSNTDCAGATPFCVAGSCSPTCASNSNCPGATPHCISGSCSACPTACGGSTPHCISGSCSACPMACGGSTPHCVSGSCSACPTACGGSTPHCVSGSCSACPTPCSYPFMFCVGGSCSACPTACGGSTPYCVGGSCSACSMACYPPFMFCVGGSCSACPTACGGSTPYCVGGSCSACPTACGGSTPYCVGGSCSACSMPCFPPNVCVSGACSNPLVG